MAIDLPSYGFFRVAVASPEVTVADPDSNAREIHSLYARAAQAGSGLVVFPELAISGYTCADLFQHDRLLDAAEAALTALVAQTRKSTALLVFGAPVRADGQLFNCAVVAQEGRVLGVVPKTFIPGYKEFYEKRWFSPAARRRSSTVRVAGERVPFGEDLLFEAEGDERLVFGFEICEDLWVPLPPSSGQAVAGALILSNLSASNAVIGKADYRRELVRSQSGRCAAAYLYAGAGVTESTTDLVFDGHLLVAENGVVLAENGRFARASEFVYADIDVDRLFNERRRLTSFFDAENLERARGMRRVGLKKPRCRATSLARRIDPHPFVPSDPEIRRLRCREIFRIQTAGLAKRLQHSGAKTAVVGVSGGLDSTLALLVAVETFDLLGWPRAGVLGVTMPGFGTSDRTLANARSLIRSLGASSREIPISEACLKHFSDIGHDPARHDVTYENVQARERTQILMDLANKEGGLVVGTGDVSELALGWCTYNGDHMSNYGVNASIPKTLVRYLVGWVADHQEDGEGRRVLHDILQTPITPELLPPAPDGSIRQKTEDVVGPYEVHDFFLYHFLRYGAAPPRLKFLAAQAFGLAYQPAEIDKWLRLFIRRFFAQQFKRSCLPDGPKVGTISLSPRGDWRMPSDASAAAWLGESD